MPLIALLHRLDRALAASYFESLAMRQQLAVLNRKTLRPRLHPPDRWFWGCKNSLQVRIMPPYQYALGERFPLYFAVLALSIGGASYVNARLAMRYGMRPLSGWAIKVLSAISLAFLAVAFAADGHPPLWALMAYLTVTFFCMGIIFGNFNAMAVSQASPRP